MLQAPLLFLAAQTQARQDGQRRNEIDMSPYFVVPALLPTRVPYVSGHPSTTRIGIRWLLEQMPGENIVGTELWCKPILPGGMFERLLVRLRALQPCASDDGAISSLRSVLATWCAYRVGWAT